MFSLDIAFDICINQVRIIHTFNPYTYKLIFAIHVTCHVTCVMVGKNEFICDDPLICS